MMTQLNTMMKLKAEEKKEKIEASTARKKDLDSSGTSPEKYAEQKVAKKKLEVQAKLPKPFSLKKGSDEDYGSEGHIIDSDYY